MIYSVEKTGKMIAASFIHKIKMNKLLYYFLMAGLLIRGVVPRMSYNQYLEKLEGPLPEMLKELNEVALRLEDEDERKI